MKMTKTEQLHAVSLASANLGSLAAISRMQRNLVPLDRHIGYSEGQESAFLLAASAIACALGLASWISDRPRDCAVQG